MHDRLLADPSALSASQIGRYAENLRLDILTFNASRSVFLNGHGGRGAGSARRVKNRGCGDARHGAVPPGEGCFQALSRLGLRLSKPLSSNRAMDFRRLAEDRTGRRDVP
jgi:hypothetical protein